jgi:hypothetical protein
MTSYLKVNVSAVCTPLVAPLAAVSTLTCITTPLVFPAEVNPVESIVAGEPEVSLASEAVLVV